MAVSAARTGIGTIRVVGIAVVPVVVPAGIAPAGIPIIPSGPPAPAPAPVEAPAPTPIGGIIAAEIETGAPVIGIAPVAPRREINGIDDDIAAYDRDVVETGTVHAVDEVGRVVIIIVITFRSRIVRVFEQRQPTQVTAFVSVAVSVDVAVRIASVQAFQYDAFVRIGLCQHGFDACAARFRFGPCDVGLPALGLCDGLPVVRAVHVVVVRGCRGVPGCGASCGQYGGDTRQGRSQTFYHLSHGSKRYVMTFLCL